MQGPVLLDGAHGEGGGQILRTAASLSFLTGRPFEIQNIRAKRSKPGLRPQHSGILRFLAESSGGSVEGAEVGSSHVRFTPGSPRAAGYEYDIGTAGSITLFLQAVLPVFLCTRGTTELIVKGGTDVPFSPPMDWYTGVYIPYVAPLVQRIEVNVDRRGFYPAGGGEVHVVIENKGGPAEGDLDALRRHVKDRLGTERKRAGNWVRADAVSIAVPGLRDEEVAERQANSAAHKVRRELRFAPNQHIDYVGAHSMGSAIMVRLADDSGNVLAGDAIGEAHDEPERLGQKAAADVLEDAATGATVDRHFADQVVPWIALGAGAVRVPRSTGHLETNIETCRAFLGADAVRLEGNLLRGK